MKKIFNKEDVFTFLFLIIALRPFLDLDYLAYDFLNSIGIPKPTTVINFVLLPLCVLLIFWWSEKNKKRVLTFFVLYSIIFGIYFLFHCKSAELVQYEIHLTDNFFFSLTDEVIYTLTLLIPLVYVYVFSLSNVSENILKKISISISCLTSLPIFISNIFTFGLSTYEGITKDNFLSWFALPFNHQENHPRYYATKFFFEEGNTIGILMFMVLPFLYYFLYREEKKNKKIVLSILIGVHSLAMIMLSTRIATYGAALIPFVVLAIYIFLILLKEEKVQKWFIGILILFTIINAVIIPFGPAYQNQQIDAYDYGAVKGDDDLRAEGMGAAKKEGLVKWSTEWRNYFVYIFEDYQFLINVTPPIYYTEWYSYKYDPQFWVDLIFDYELADRVSGRQIQTIFNKYKWDEMSNTERLLGTGYSTFMNGSINIERDFVQQYYSYGPIGVVLIMGPWVIILAYLGIKLLLGFKKKKWTFMNILLLMSICLGFVSSYMSGHVFDEFASSIFISLCMGFLFKNLKDKVSE